MSFEDDKHCHSSNDWLGSNIDKPKVANNQEKVQAMSKTLSGQYDN